MTDKKEKLIADTIQQNEFIWNFKLEPDNRISMSLHVTCLLETDFATKILYSAAGIRNDIYVKDEADNKDASKELNSSTVEDVVRLDYLLASLTEQVLEDLATCIIVSSRGTTNDTPPQETTESRVQDS